MILSKSCIYGIQAAIFVASQEATGYVSINRISDALGISFHFLTKVLQQLSSSGIMISYRGPRGGVMLNKRALEVTLYDLIEAIDGTGIFTECMLGLPGCGTEEPCPAHEHWVEIRASLTSVARGVTLHQLGSRATDLNVRLARELIMDRSTQKP